MRGLSLVAASGGYSSSWCVGLSPSWPLSLRSTGSRRAGSVVVAHGPSRSAARGIPPDQGPNPCPPHRQADSQPPRHQGSPSDQEILCPPTGVCFGGCRRYIYLEDYSKVNDTKESNCCVLKVQTEREVCALDPKAGTSKF